MNEHIYNELRKAEELFRNLMLKKAETRNPFKKLYYLWLAARVHLTIQRFNSLLEE
ncbi:hypothetical protein [Symmachiella dynata]|uniref:hypothetical protein n=1 Tax=Symmachiella dynata TaxID=2527995 RepID=UPI0018D3492B|nr:hypothetical protein [Symmachiella dynata]